jgi:hypothetical protein
MAVHDVIHDGFMTGSNAALPDAGYLTDMRAA